MLTKALVAVISTLYIGSSMARADTVQLYAAGSLRGALIDIAKAFDLADSGSGAVAFLPG